MTLIGSVGDDDHGRMSEADLVAHGVALDLERSGRATGVALISVDPSGENQIVVAPGANGALSPGHVAAALTRLAADGPITVLASLEVPVGSVAASLTTGGVSLVLNAAPAQHLPREILSRTAVVIANEHEALLLHADGVQGLLAGGCGAVVVTLGKDGCAIYLPGAEPIEIAAPTVDAVDTVGAGDAFSAALATALAAGRSVVEAAELGVRAGSIAVTQPGARVRLPHLDDLADWPPE